jgi:hypothetical protein
MLIFLLDDAFVTYYNSFFLSKIGGDKNKHQNLLG